MKNRGFTLIELLAVIVILAIIALITTPIVVGIIKDAKEKATIASTQNYIDAIELAIMQKNMKGNIKNIDGNYTIVKSGKQIKKGDFLIDINYDGSEFNEGTVEIKNQKVEALYANINNLYSSFKDSDIKLFKEKAILIEGREFNSIIKNLANNSTDLTVEYEDTLIKKIEFLSFGKLPENYTLETLKNLKNADVSEKQNNSIVAYYDKETQTIYIYSENKIIFNSQSTKMFLLFTAVETINFGDFIDTSNVTSMSYMFELCSSLTNLDLSKWNTDRVTDIGYMFHFMSNLENLNISNFDTSEVTNMNSMFTGCIKLKTLDVSNFNTSKVTSMRKMFRHLHEVTNLDLSNFDFSKLDNVSYMFENSYKLSEIKVSNNWNLDKYTYKDDVFLNCGKDTPSGQCKIIIVNN